MPRSLQCMRSVGIAIQYFSKGASCPRENAYGFHSRWHQSCTREGSQDKASVWGKNPLKRVNIKTGCYLIADSADYFVVRHWVGRICHDDAKQLPLKCSTSGLSENPAYAFSTIRAIFVKNRNSSCIPSLLWRTAFAILSNRIRNEATKFTLIKHSWGIFQNIEYWEDQSRLNF